MEVGKLTDTQSYVENVTTQTAELVECGTTNPKVVTSTQGLSDCIQICRIPLSQVEQWSVTCRLLRNMVRITGHHYITEIPKYC